MSFSCVELQRPSSPARTEEPQLPTLTDTSVRPFPLHVLSGAVQKLSSPAPSALLAHRASPAHQRANGAPPTSVGGPRGAGPREASGAFPGRIKTSLQGDAWIVRCWTGRPLGRGLWVAPLRPVLPLLGCWSWLRRERSEETRSPGCAAASLSPSGSSGDPEEKRAIGPNPWKKTRMPGLPTWPSA